MTQYTGQPMWVGQHSQPDAQSPHVDKRPPSRQTLRNWALRELVDSPSTPSVRCEGACGTRVPLAYAKMVTEWPTEKWYCRDCGRGK